MHEKRTNHAKGIGQNSRQLIAQALLGLMREDDYAKITITQIAQRAGVARLTFYRHFETKEEVLRWSLEGLFAAYREEYQSSGSASLLDALELCFEYWRRNDELLRSLSGQGLQLLLFEPFDAYTREMLARFGVGGLEPLQVSFLSGGLCAAMMQWVTGSNAMVSARSAASKVLKIVSLEPAPASSPS